MVDTRRLSSFPPLLGQYNTEIESKFEHIPKSYRATADIKSLLERQQLVTGSIVANRKTCLMQEAPCPRARRKKSTSNKKFEEEANLKLNKKQEITLKVWDAMVSEEKKQRHFILQERVKTQRSLICKNDELSNDFKVKAEKERLEKLQRRKARQKEVTTTLKAHLQRVEEHKQMINKKMQQISLSDNKTTPIALSIQQEITDSEALSPPQIVQETHHKLVLEPAQGGDCCINFWKIWKRKGIRKLTPIIRRSDQLKQTASPSAKQYLEVYEQPSPHSRDTANVIPLSDVLGQVSTGRGHSHSTRNSALGTISRLTQQKAEIMLNIKEPFSVINKYCHPRNYFQETLQNLEPSFSPRSKSTGSTHGKHIPVLQPKRYKTTPTIKKQLPSYLTSSGNVCSGSLVEFGDILYCTPSRTKDLQKTSEYSHSEDPIFLTDLQRHAATSPSSCSHASPLYNHLSKGDKGINMLRAKEGEGIDRLRAKKEFKTRPAWQPLSSSALSEYHNVTEVPVSGLGHDAHGRYSMWKPSSCIVDPRDTCD